MKVSTYNEYAMKDSKQIEQNPKRARARSAYNRGKTILNEDKTSSFEDSRVTILHFEQYKMIELVRFLLILASASLTIIEYEYSYEIEQWREDAIKLLLWIILIHSVLLYSLTYLSYSIRLKYKKAAQLATPKARLSDTSLFSKMILEYIILLPSSLPFQSVIDCKIYFTDYTPSYGSHYYRLNELMTYYMLLRFIVATNILIKFSRYYSSSVARMCRLYSTNHTTHFCGKLFTRDHPLWTMAVLLLVGIFVSGYSEQIAERPSKRYQSVSEESTLSNSFWVTIITTPAVGYGDIFPVTDLGRISMTICVYYGVSLASVFVAALLNLLLPTSGESLSWALLLKKQLTEKMKLISRRIIIETQKLKIDKFKGILIRNRQVANIAADLQHLQYIKRAQTDIEGEDFYAKTRRQFREIQQLIEEYKSYLLKMIAQQKIILSALDRPLEFSFKSSRFPQQQQQQQRRLQTIEKQSKDDLFFANLQCDETDPYLMDFNDY